MTLFLQHPKTSPGVSVKTWGDGIVHICQHEIHEDDFFDAVKYVIENTNISGRNDVRMKFIEYVRSLAAVKGFDDTTKAGPKVRLEPTPPPLFPQPVE